MCSSTAHDNVVKRFVIDRLGKQFHAAGGLGSGDQLRVDASFRQQDALQVPLMLTGFLKKSQSHSVRHVQIEDDHVMIASGQQMSGRSFVMGPSDVEAQRFEIIEQIVTEVPIVLYDQQRKASGLGRDHFLWAPLSLRQ